MKRISKILLMVLSISLLFACGPIQSPGFDEESQEEINTIIHHVNNAQQITLKKQPLSFSNINFKVYADQDYVGRVKGKVFNVVGDEVVFTSPNGNVLGSEKQMKRWGIKFNRMAQVYNKDGMTSGYIGERVFNDMFKIRYSMHFFDVNKNEIGHTKKKIFSLFNNNDLYNNNNELTHEIKGRASIFTKYTIDVVQRGEMDNIDVIFFTVIQDAINRAGKNN